MISVVADRLGAAWRSVRRLLRRSEVEGELSEELAFHLEMETRKNVAAGMSPGEARRAAVVSFHGVERYKEEVRAARRTAWLEWLVRDVAMALRTLRRSPGVAGVVILTLGLGIGATTAIFSLVDAAVLEPLPWADPDRLVLVRERTAEGMPFTVSEPNYLDFRSAAALEELAAFREVQPSLTGDGEPVRLSGMAVTHTLFPLLGARAAIGRTFSAAEDRPGGDARVVVLGHDVWRGRFGADSSVVGSTVVLGGEGHLVTGVMPEDFEFFGADLWVPLAPDPGADRLDHWLEVVGRLRPGASVQGAEAELAGISASIASTTPAMTGWGVEVRRLHDAVVGPEFGRASTILIVAVGLLLLMACANVANLLLARATARQAELGIRAALGAGRGRLARQILTETVVLAGGGAILGGLGAAWVIGAVRAAGPDAIPRVENLAVDLRVLAFTVAAALLTALLAGLLPALHAGRTDPAERLRGGARGGVSRGQRRTREMLVVGQVAVAVVLLVGAGLMLRSFARIQAVDPGFVTEDIWTVPLQLPTARYPAEERQYFAFRDLLEAVRAVPGVRSAAAAFVEPFSGFSASNDVTPADRAAEASPAGYMSAAWRIVSPGYFETMGVPLLRGRLFTAEDRYGNPPTVIITRTLAARLWPGQDPIGRGLFWGGVDGEPRTVVGVVGDVRDVELRADPPPLMFLSHRQLIVPSMTLLVRTAPGVEGVPAGIRRAIWRVDPELPVPDVRPLAHSRAAAVAGPRFNAVVLATFAAVALALAAVGLYGLLAFVVARRTREIGVRRALGAGSATVSRMVVRRGVLLAAVGMVLGLLGALGLGRGMSSLLYRTGAADPLTFAAVAGLFAVVAVVAAWLPARRAARVDPVVALRSE